MVRFLWQALATAAALSLLGVTLTMRPAAADEIAGPGVARVSLAEGDVGIRRGDTGTTVAATLNAPLLAGDYLSTGDDGRAEVQLDGRSMIRAGPDVQLRFVALEAGQREAQLAQGTIELRTFARYEGQPQIDTPSIALRASGDGGTRITVDSDGGTHVTVRLGQVEVLTPDRSFTLAPGTTLVAHGDASAPSIEYAPSQVYAVFDTFCGQRDEEVQRALAVDYLPPAIGYDDFEAYGRWVVDPGYGRVWAPSVTLAGWAPYRYGRWVWEDGYGWVWVSDEPWGWAPYHYGRWFYSTNFGWCWLPPRVGVRPIWSPALVGFFTFGNVAVGIGYPNIAWVPLAPFEVYHPWYFWNGTNFHPITVVNVTVVENVTRIYANINRPNAITGVSHQRFLAGRFDHPQSVAVGELHHVSAVHGAAPVIPTERNLTFSNRTVSPQLQAQTEAIAHRPFAGAAGSAMRRTPFGAQRTMMSTGTRVDPWIRFNGAGSGTTSGTSHSRQPSSSSNGSNRSTASSSHKSTSHSSNLAGHKGSNNSPNPH